jgi:uncharacterized protein
MMKAFDASAAVFVRGLTNLKSLLMKGEAHAVAHGIAPAKMINAQLADDMYDLSVQAHWAAEGAKLAVARLLGSSATPIADGPKSFAEIYGRIDATVASLSAVDPEALEAGLDRTIELRHRGTVMTYRGDEFITQYAVPSFFFHVATAYGILRHQGVPLQKGDFLGA